MRLRSWAKVNLTLEVFGRRSDGYHEIDSVAQVIDVADELEVARAETGVVEIESDAPDLPSGRENLVYRACRVFFRATGAGGGARVRLTKRIPVQAGLGGGSSNAAAVICALNLIYGCELAPAQLGRIAAVLGSDVALFVYGGTVRVRGRGDDVTELTDAPALDLVVVKPAVGVATGWAYRELDQHERRKATDASERAQNAIFAGDREALLECMQNDFDPVVSSSVAEVGQAKVALIEGGARIAMLAGSGSAVFGVFADAASAQAAAERLRKRSMNAFAARSVPRQRSALVR